MKILKYVLISAFAFSLAAGGVYAAALQITGVSGADVQWAFTQANEKPEKLLISVIDSAKTSLDVTIYSLTYPDIVDAIKIAKSRGVVVRVISDRIQSSGKSQQEALKLLGSAGIPIMINKHSGLMHLKMVVADKKIATTGSFNYTKAASTTNDEVFVVIRNADIAKSFDEQFERMWNDTKGFESITPKIAQPNDTIPTPLPSGKATSSGNVIYKNCAAVRAAGKAPLHKGDPGYSSKLDRDGDGIACEK